LSYGPAGLSGLIIPDTVRRRNRAASSLNGVGAGGKQQGGQAPAAPGHTAARRQ